ncbi:MAG: SIMPL domain-containing protein, partial [Vicinamibacterales bacterium]
DAIANGAGVQIDRVLRIEEQRQATVRSMDVLAPRAAMMGVAAQPAVPIESGELEVRAQVTLTATIR